MKIIIISVFGILGVLLRYFMDVYFSKKFPSTFPLGIFAINILGCAIIGVVFALTQKQVIDTEWAQTFSIGFLGGLTTFSTFSLDMLKLFLQNQIFIGLLYGIASPVIGLALTSAGYFLTKILISK